jgi:hypothetical protein
MSNQNLMGYANINVQKLLAAKDARMEVPVIDHTTKKQLKMKTTLIVSAKIVDAPVPLYAVLLSWLFCVVCCRLHVRVDRVWFAGGWCQTGFWQRSGAAQDCRNRQHQTSAAHLPSSFQHQKRRHSRQIAEHHWWRRRR